MALVSQEDDDDIEIPPSQPESGLPILAHKLWVGNIDKRITELVSFAFKMEHVIQSLQETACEDLVGIRQDKIMEIYVAPQWSKSW